MTTLSSGSYKLVGDRLTNIGHKPLIGDGTPGMAIAANTLNPESLKYQTLKP